MTIRTLLYIFILTLSQFPTFAQSPSENDLINAYLKLNNITSNPGDWSTCQIGDGPVQICSWNTTDLGTQPSQTTLNTYSTAALNIDQANNFQSIINSNITITCTPGDAYCNSSITYTYPFGLSYLAQISTEVISLTTRGIFSTGATTIDLTDINNINHTFTIQQFLEYATAMCNYYTSAVSARDTFLTGANASYPTFPSLTSVNSLTLPSPNTLAIYNNFNLLTYSSSLPSSTTVPWAQLTNTPTTLSGYGITSVPWSVITNTPTTISGYGISSIPYSAITGTPAAPLTGTVSIPGGTLAIGGCLSTVTATITGATTSSKVIATPASDPGPYIINAWVSSANTISLRVCAGVAGTINTETWNIAVLQ
jgi:hypothetical protein